MFETDGERLAIFLGDFYARPSKRGGAWMNAYVSQSELLGTQPVVANHLNVPKPPDGEPTLLVLPATFLIWRSAQIRRAASATT